MTVTSRELPSGVAADEERLLLAIPDSYSALFQADSTYGTIVYARTLIPHDAYRFTRHRLFHQLGTSFRISSAASAPVWWLPSHFTELLQGQVYLSPPCGLLGGRQIRFIFPRGWHLKDLERAKSGWEKFTPKLLLPI